MGDFAVVLCAKEFQRKTSLAGRLITYCYPLADFIKGRSGKITSKHVELYEGVLNCHIVLFPYSINSLSSFKSRKQRRIGAQLSHFCSEAGIQEIILPDRIRTLGLFDSRSIISYSGQYLFSSLIIKILTDIFCSKGIMLRDIDISLIHGESYNELYSFIWLLSPYVKYLTVVTEEKEYIEKELERICDDTGLSIRTTGNLENGLRESDVIINLNDTTKFNCKTRIKTRALVINYKSPDICKLLKDNTVINGIEVSLPSCLRNKLPPDVFDYFNKLEISEVILAHKLGRSSEILDNVVDSRTMELIGKEFDRDGFKLTGFLGRHSIVKKEEIKITSTLSGEII